MHIQFVLHILLFYCFALFFILLHILLLISFFTYIYIYSCVVLLLYNLILILFLIFYSLHCPLSGPDLTYISLLIIPCIIYHVTNKETLTLTLYIETAVFPEKGYFDPYFNFLTIILINVFVQSHSWKHNLFSSKIWRSTIGIGNNHGGITEISTVGLTSILVNPIPSAYFCTFHPNIYY